jgi:predicted Rossmann fold flavoprotein
MGISVPDAQVRIPTLKMQERGALLVTHWGLSGPAVLKLSSRAARDLQAMDYRFDCEVNWLPEFHESAMLEHLKGCRSSLKQELGNRNPFGLVSRLWLYLIARAGADGNVSWKEQPNQALIALSKILCKDTYVVSGKTTFKDEFVTAGGVNLSELDPATMESRKVKGLFFAGEYMDVDGITGGYNFQHAWSSGWIAAKSISSRV